MVRTQLFLDEDTHVRLRRLARRQGRTVSDLVRDAIARVYGKGEATRRISTLRAVAGLWRGRRDLGPTGEYVRRLRRSTRRGSTRGS